MDATIKRNLSNLATEDLINEIARRKRNLEQKRDEIEATWWAASKLEKMEVLWQIPPYTQAELDNWISAGIIAPTGSAVYGRGVEPNDYDYVTSGPFAMFRKTIGPPIPKSEYGWPVEYADAVHVRWARHENGKLINFIFTTPDTEKAWAKATELLDEITLRYPEIGRYKWRRVRMMRALKDVFITPAPTDGGPSLTECILKTICFNCGREAINFIDSAHEKQYRIDGICDRCREELGMGAQI